MILPPHEIPPFSADELYPGLWQGSAPPTGTFLRERGFTHLALCAFEHQPAPADRYFPCVDVFYAPNDDNFEGLTRAQASLALTTARKVANAVQDGGKVLVTCRMGINRSGLVSAIALHILTGKPGVACVRVVQSKRRRALRNPAFVEMLGRLVRPAKAA